MGPATDSDACGVPEIWQIPGHFLRDSGLPSTLPWEACPIHPTKERPGKIQNPGPLHLSPDPFNSQGVLAQPCAQGKRWQTLSSYLVIVRRMSLRVDTLQCGSASQARTLLN